MIHTVTKQLFDPDDPKTIWIEDIAYSLSQRPRFNGHLPTFVSIAEHSLMVSRLMGGDLSGLMHDACEAYVPDVPYPWKSLPIVQDYLELEHKIQKVIDDKFDSAPRDLELLKKVDRLSCVIECVESYRKVDKYPPEWTEEFNYTPGTFNMRFFTPNEAFLAFLDEFNAWHPHP